MKYEVGQEIKRLKQNEMTEEKANEILTDKMEIDDGTVTLDKSKCQITTNNSFIQITLNQLKAIVYLMENRKG